MTFLVLNNHVPDTSGTGILFFRISPDEVHIEIFPDMIR
jgi:hypothetical protein